MRSRQERRDSGWRSKPLRNERYCLHRVLEGAASVGAGYRKSKGSELRPKGKASSDGRARDAHCVRKDRRAEVYATDCG